MEALIIAQTIFYFTVSAAIIVLGALCAIVAYYLIRITKELEAMSRDWHDASDEARERINDIIDRLSDLPILSYFLRKEPRRSHEDGGSREEDEPRHAETHRTKSSRKGRRKH